MADGSQLVTQARHTCTCGKHPTCGAKDNVLHPDWRGLPTQGTKVWDFDGHNFSFAEETCRQTQTQTHRQAAVSSRVSPANQLAGPALADYRRTFPRYVNCSFRSSTPSPASSAKRLTLMQNLKFHPNLVPSEDPLCLRVSRRYDSPLLLRLARLSSDPCLTNAAVGIRMTLQETCHIFLPIHFHPGLDQPYNVKCDHGPWKPSGLSLP